MATETAVATPPPATGEPPVVTPSAPAAKPRDLVRIGTFAAVGALMLISLWQRTRGLSLHFWVDEGLSVGIAGHPLSQIPGVLRQDGSPPLYYLLLHLWMAWRGNGEVVTHELSLLFAMLTIPTAYWAGSSLFDRKAGLVCAVLAAGAPYLTTYAEETRMYSLMALLSLLAATSFAHVFILRHRRHLALFVVSLTAAMYTHNWGLFLGVMAGATFLYCVWQAPAEARRGLWIDGLIAFGAVAVLFLPWLPTVLYQAKHTGAPWDLPPVVWSLSAGTYFIVGGRGAATALLLGGGAGLLTLRGARSEARRKLELVAKALLVLAIGTLLIAWIASKITPAWAPRYLAVVIGPLILVFGLGLSRGGRLAAVALALASCWWLLDPVPLNIDAKSDVATAVAQVRPHIRPGTLVISTQPEQVPTIAYYMPRDVRYATPLGIVPDPRVMDWRGALDRFRGSRVNTVLMPLLASIPKGQRVVLITALNLSKTPEWMERINLSTRVYTRILDTDPRFVRIAKASPHVESGLGVRVSVYLRR